MWLSGARSLPPSGATWSCGSAASPVLWTKASTRPKLVSAGFEDVDIDTWRVYDGIVRRGRRKIRQRVYPGLQAASYERLAQLALARKWQAIGPMSPTAARRPSTCAAAAAAAVEERPIPGSDLHDPSLYFDRELSWLSFNGVSWIKPNSTRRVVAIRCSSASSFWRSPQTTSTSFSWCDSTSAPRSRVCGRRPCSTSCRNTGRRACGLSWPPSASSLSNPSDYTDDDRAFVEKYFNVHVCPVLTPLAFDPGHPFPHISNRSRNLAIVVDHRGRTKFARVKVPDLLPRFVALPSEEGTYRFALLEDVIRENLGQLFPGVGIRTAHFFRIVRDMDMSVAHTHDAAETLLEVVDRGLKQQRHGPLSLLEVERGMPTRVLDILLENFEAAARRGRPIARTNRICRLDPAHDHSRDPI